MRKIRLIVFYWLPILFWMSVIFGASSDSGSSRHTSRFLEPLVHWLLPHCSHETFETIVLVVRKAAHVTEYAILTAMLWRACRATKPTSLPGWHWPHALAALWLAIFYATTDEFHQTFVPSREGCVRDVCIDGCGAMAAIFVIWFIGRRLKRW